RSWTRRMPSFAKRSMSMSTGGPPPIAQAPSVEDHYRLDLEQRPPGQAGDADGGARGERLREELLHDLVGHREAREVREVERQLHAVGKRPARGRGDRREVPERLPDLGLEAARDDLPGRRVERDLAGEIDGVAGPDGLRIGADRRGRIRRRNDLLAHGLSVREGWVRPGCSPGFLTGAQPA